MKVMGQAAVTAFEIVLAFSGRGQILFREVYPHHLSRAVGGGKAKWRPSPQPTSSTCRFPGEGAGKVDGVHAHGERASW